MRFAIGTFAVLGFAVFIGCQQEKVANSTSGKQASAEKLEQVRLHFTNFKKSKSGAT